MCLKTQRNKPPAKIIKSTFWTKVVTATFARFKAKVIKPTFWTEEATSFQIYPQFPRDC